MISSLIVHTRVFSSLARSTLRGYTMYNFLEKLVTIISFYDYPVKIQRNSIQLSMAMSLLQLFSEIQNHFEIKSRQIVVYTYDLK
jgi:hypothetical protein